MEYVAVARHHPELKVWLHFLTNEVAEAMKRDGMRNSHPIVVSQHNFT